MEDCVNYIRHFFICQQAFLKKSDIFLFFFISYFFSPYMRPGARGEAGLSPSHTPKINIKATIIGHDSVWKKNQSPVV